MMNVKKQCANPVVYHWRCERRHAKVEARRNRRVQILLAVSAGAFLWALAFGLTCRLIGVV